MYSYGRPHMAQQKQDNQLEHTYSSYVRIRYVALKTCQMRWTIGRSDERGSGIFVLAARHNDDDVIVYIKCIPIYDVLKEFGKNFLGKRPALFKSSLWIFHQDNTPVYNSILVTDYLTNIGIKTLSHRPYSPDLAPCDLWLFPKLRGCRYETIEEMKEAVTKVFDTLTQEDFHGALPKL